MPAGPARLRPRRWRGALLAVAALCLAAAAYLGVTGFLLHRLAAGILTVGPLAEALAAGPRPQDPLALGHRGTPRDSLGLDHETVAIPTELGPAEAWWVPAAGATGLAAIYVHGIAGAREDGFRHLSMLHAAGVPTLLISYRNDPGAPAAPEGLYGFGLTEWRDLEAAARHLAGRRLLIVAESMGAGVLGQFLAQSEESARVAAVALDSPALDFRGVLRHLAAQRGLPLPGAIARVAEGMLRLRLPLDVGQARVLPVFAGFPGPLFVAHGTGDRIVPVAGTEALLAGRPGISLSLRTGADHLGSFAEAPEPYRRLFGAFLALAAE